jgi:hypothetical protein
MAIPTNSSIYRYGTSPQTRSVVSTKNRIFAPAAGGNQLIQVGVMSTFTPSESRTVEPVRGIGFGDQVAELVPGVTDPMQISVTRTALYLANVYQVFGYNAGTSGLVRSLKHHKFPFDIKHEIIFSDLAENTQAANVKSVTLPGGQSVRALITFFEGCWMTSYSTDFTADTAMVQESVDILVTDITDGSSIYNEFINSGLNPTTDYGSTIYR